MRDEAVAFDLIAAAVCICAWWGFRELGIASKGGKSFFDRWLKR
jgi:hypothetical protein